jgi:hypothetical protein
MTPLIFAALAPFVLPPGASPPPGAVLPDPSTLPLVQRTAQAASSCANLSTKTVAPDGVPMFKRLDQLPKGVMEHAVWRTVSGCPVREIVYGGQTYYLASANPRIERLDPAVGAPVQAPITRFDRPDGH